MLQPQLRLAGEGRGRRAPWAGWPAAGARAAPGVRSGEQGRVCVLLVHAERQHLSDKEPFPVTSAGRQLLPANMPRGEGEPVAAAAGAGRQAGVNRENMGASGWRTRAGSGRPLWGCRSEPRGPGAGSRSAPEPEAAARQLRLTLSAWALPGCGSLRRGDLGAGEELGAGPASAGTHVTSLQPRPAGAGGRGACLHALLPWTWIGRVGGEGRLSVHPGRETGRLSDFQCRDPDGKHHRAPTWRAPGRGVCHEHAPPSSADAPGEHPGSLPPHPLPRCCVWPAYPVACYFPEKSSCLSSPFRGNHDD